MRGDWQHELLTVHKIRRNKGDKWHKGLICSGSPLKLIWEESPENVSQASGSNKQERREPSKGECWLSRTEPAEISPSRNPPRMHLREARGVYP